MADRATRPRPTTSLGIGPRHRGMSPVARRSPASCRSAGHAVESDAASRPELAARPSMGGGSPAQPCRRRVAGRSIHPGRNGDFYRQDSEIYREGSPSNPTTRDRCIATILSISIAAGASCSCPGSLAHDTSRPPAKLALYPARRFAWPATPNPLGDAPGIRARDKEAIMQGQEQAAEGTLAHRVTGSESRFPASRPLRSMQMTAASRHPTPRSAP